MYDYSIYQDMYEYFVEILFYSASTFIFHEEVRRHILIIILRTHVYYVLW